MPLGSATQTINTCRKNSVDVFEEEAKIRTPGAIKWFILEL
jgi:hypothetical protein